jgi:hypothetical protein
LFSALCPLLTDSGVNGWMRETLGTCTDMTECTNSVIVDWHAPSLLSLDARTYGYKYCIGKFFMSACITFRMTSI